MTAVPLLFFAAAASRVPLSTLGLLQYLTPVLQLLTGVLLYDEPMPASRLVGFALVWAALVVLSVDGLRHHRQDPARRRRAGARRRLSRHIGASSNTSIANRALALGQERVLLGQRRRRVQRSASTIE